MEQFLERLHMASFMMRRNRCWCFQLRPAVFSGSDVAVLIHQGLGMEFCDDQPLARKVDCRQCQVRLIR
jgi:hypothetical protein